MKKKPLTAAANLAGKLQRKAARRTRWAAAVTEEGVKDTMHATRRAGEGVRNRVINQAKGVLKAVRKPLRTASRRRAQLKEQDGFNRVEWQVEEELDRLISRGRPIVAGPWISEVGFEALYWAPFLRWVKTAFSLDPGRVVAVSRGGVGSWYAGVASRYVEIWDLIEPGEFARKNAARGTTKHYERSPLDDEILAGVARQIGTAEFDVIHPGLMYRLFTLYWSGQRAMGFVDAHARFEPQAPPALIDPGLLPAEYVAVKFYAARSLPDTPAVRDWMRRAVAALAEQMPVVLLDTGLVLEDDHADFDIAARGRVISARPWMTPRDNLGIQTQIVAGAKAFVGTCGSIAWLAPQLGVDTSALFIDPKWLHAHLPVAMRAYHKMGGGRFSVADLRAIDPLGALAVDPGMTVLFVARHFTYFRNFESVVAAMAERGHRVHLAADREEALGGRELVDRLAARFPAQVTVGFTPIQQWGRYRRLSGALRLGLDYLRYTDERYETTPRIRARAYERTPFFVLALARLPFRGLVTRALERLEQAVPRQKGLDEFITELQPDVLLITPLIELGSPQLDYVRAARALGIRSALCVWSWDHLSSKALIRVVPDRIFVWNETQRAEALQFHGIPSAQVVVTGAQCFDQWFDRQPSRDRDTFCRRVGLPSAAPFLLYVCSALFRGSPSEPRFVAEWVAAIRRSPDARLRETGILVRMHPQRIDEWQPADIDAVLRDNGPVAIGGSNPIDAESRADYFDSMYHAGAVIGLNTSALVESAIVDRPVFTLLLPEFRDNQEGTFHFHHLLTVGDGFLHVSRSLDEHVAQLASVLGGGAVRPNRPFVERFIRPRGTTVASTPVFVEAVETLAGGERPAPLRVPAWVLALRPLVYALVLAGRLPGLDRIYWNPAKRREWAIRHS